MRDTIAAHLSHLAAAQHSHLDLKQNFKATLQTLFKFKSLSEADVGSVIPAPYHQGAIIYYTQSSVEAGLLEAQRGHNNLGFSLIHTPTHDKRALLQATKSINRAFSAYNILFFLSQDYLSIAFATRRAAKNRIEQTDVLEKITLIKDISLHSPHPAHIRNLESIANLHHSAIDEYYQSILATLSIEKLNEAFFTEIKGHFLHFCESCTLPMENPTETQKRADSTKETDSNIKREFVLRLISRLLFCKFLEKKGLINPKIWDCDLSEEYYHNVCEPLFFTTLNTKAEERDYGLLPEPITILLDSIPYLNGGLFSPQDCDFFTPKNPNAHINTLKIPNDCFTKLFATFDNYHFTLSESTPLSQEVGLDPELLGMVFENLLSVLFTDNKKNDKDLRKATGSYYTPREIVSYMCNASLLECLKERLSLDEQRLEQLVFEKRNHFNAEESGQILTTLESLKILDPACGSGAFPMGMLHEMLEIQEALIEDSVFGDFCGSSEKSLQSFMPNKLPCDFSHNPQNSLKSLESYGEDSASTSKFSKNSKGNTANLRMLEENVESQSTAFSPASWCETSGKKEAEVPSADVKLEAEKRGSPLDCRKSGDFFGVKGSGEGINPFLRKENKTNKQSYDNAEKERIHNQSTYIDDKITSNGNDQNGAEALRNFSHSHAVPIHTCKKAVPSLYNRKLKILQTNIYGVDIQPMATEIARLRCFLSLICDAPNDDIKPLPNLEFKFVTANSLIPLPKQEGLLYDGYESDMSKLRSLREQTFNASDKKALESAYLSLRDKIAREIQSAWHTHKGDFSSNPLLSWNPFDPHSVAEFFDSEWMFGIPANSGGGAIDDIGFDIIIGNPPYISVENMPQVIKDNRHLFNTAHKKTDIYVYFYEFALKILKNKGIVSYITSNKFLSQEYGLKLRELLLHNHIYNIVDFYINIFESASVDTCICLIGKQHTQDNIIKVQNIQSFEDYWRFEKRIFEKIRQDIFYSLEYYNFRLTLNESKISLLESIQNKSYRLSDICFVSYGVRPCGNSKYPNLKKKDLLHKIPTGNAKPYIEAKSAYIAPYTIHHHDYLDYQKDKIYNAMFEELFSPHKLMAGRTLANVKYINFVYDDKGRFCNDSMCCIVLWQDLESATHPSPKKQINKDKIALSKQYSLKFLQGILNSNLIRFYVKELLHDGLHFYPEHQKQLPIPQITDSNRHIGDRITTLVEEILALNATSLSLRGEAEAIQKNDIELRQRRIDCHEAKASRNDKDISHLQSHTNKAPILQRQIDELVYKLYGLTDEEIQTIQGGAR